MKLQNTLLIIFLFALQLTSISASANVLGNMQTFAPNPDSLIFQNIHSSQTLGKNYFNVGVFAAYVRNELSVYDSLTQPHYIDYKDKATTFDLVFAWGVTRYLEVTYSVPGYFKQDPDSDQTRQNFISSGVNGHRLGFKYNISQKTTGGFAFAGSADLSQTLDNPYIGNSPAPIWNAEFIYDHMSGSQGYGFNLGYRKRTPGSPAANAYFLPISDQLIASAGYVWGLSTKWRFHAETFASYGLKKDDHPDQTNISSLEVLLGLKHRLAKNLWGHLGATVEALPKGLAPDYRIYTGLNYFFGFGPGAETATAAGMPLAVEPEEINIAQYEKQSVIATGGMAPYKYQLSKGLGSFDEETLEYVSYQPGSEELIVMDSEGAKVTVPILVREKAPTAESPHGLKITPAESTIYTGGIVQFKVSGGDAPYTPAVSPAGTGRMINLKFQSSTSRSGDVRITIKDRQGHSGTAVVHVLDIPKPAKALVLNNLNFIFDTDKLTKASEKDLDKNVASISQVKIKKIIVVGHTDSKGSDEYNQELSQRRAEAVAKTLRRKFKLREDQVEAVGYGESQPIATNETEAGRSRNRRVELKLYYDQ